MVKSPATLNAPEIDEDLLGKIFIDYCTYIIILLYIIYELLKIIVDYCLEAGPDDLIIYTIDFFFSLHV